MGHADDLNLYAYVRNDPFNLSDPTGLFTRPPWKDDCIPGRESGCGAPQRGPYQLGEDDAGESGGDNTNFYQLGWEWLTGTGPRRHDFGPSDPATLELRSHSFIRNQASQIGQSGFEVGTSGTERFSLAGVNGVGLFMEHYAAIPTNGTLGNLAVGYLGSYRLDWTITGADEDSVTIQFGVTNESTLASGLRPPIIGYQNWWQESVGAALNDVAEGGGPMSTTTQTFTWSERVPSR